MNVGHCSDLYHGKQFYFPKAELHCHLEGCFRWETVIDVARKRGIKLPSYEVKILKEQYSASKRCESLDAYLKFYDFFTGVFAGDLEAIARMTQEAIEDKLKENVRYLELRFCPFALLASSDQNENKENGKKVTASDVVQTVCETAAASEERTGIVVRIILGAIVRHPEWSMDIARMCKHSKDKGVVGMDILGSRNVDGSEFAAHREAFEFCKENKIHVTVHAGENGNAEEVKQGLEVLGAERIGHGYHVVDDESIYSDAKRRGVHFEFCLMSSFLTASADPDWKKHPSIRLMKDEVNFSLSSDCPGLQVSTLDHDYDLAEREFGFSDKQLQALNLNALRSCFADEQTKTTLIQQFTEAYDKYNQE